MEHHGFDFNAEAFWAAHDYLTIAPPSGPSWASPFHDEGSLMLAVPPGWLKTCNKLAGCGSPENLANSVRV